MNWQRAANAPRCNAGVCAFAYLGGKPVTGKEDMASAANESRLTAFQQGHLLTRRGPLGLADRAGGGSSVVLTSQPLGKRAWIERPALQYRDSSTTN